MNSERARILGSLDYQLNSKDWPPETFRYEIWERERWHWGYGKKRGDAVPATGDTIVFFYAPSGGDDPGIYMGHC